MNDNILIGKYTLESLTSGMYLSSLDLYREYIQNAADSIDEAVDQQLILKDEAVVNIEINKELKTITISDNGTGIDQNHAYESLIDIGNSKKNYQRTRGFRGIGRLSGLGYCDLLTFETSALNEPTKTVITYDSKRLQQLLLPEEGQDSLSDVLNQVISFQKGEENPEKHYFTVKMTGVRNEDGLLDKEKVFDYLVQNLPLPFDKRFIWGSLINEKIKNMKLKVPQYNIFLTFNGRKEQLFKPYKNTILSDRVRRIYDPIQDIRFKTFYVNDKLCALLWYVENNYYGTILDVQVKGIRLRDGNILFGDQGALRKCFKEARFSGWGCGELQVISSDFIQNARRDDFDRNDVYLNLLHQIAEWAKDITKVIREKSHQRNLSEAESKLINAAGGDDDYTLDASINCDNTMGESDLMDFDDSRGLANFDLLNSLSILSNTGNNVTKYKSLNLSNKLTREQKLTYEKIFDVIYDKFAKKTANRVVQTLIDTLV